MDIISLVLQASLLSKKGSHHENMGGGLVKHYSVALHYLVRLSTSTTTIPRATGVGKLDVGILHSQTLQTLRKLEST